MIRVVATGEPQPKGSPKVVTHGRGGVPLKKPLVIHDSHDSERWAKNVAGAALVATWKRAPFVDQALVVRARFRFERPKGHFGKHGLLPSAPAYPAVKPDVDKLVRNVLDAISKSERQLTGWVIDNDSRVVELHASKRYCAPGESPGVEIEVEPFVEQVQEQFHLPAAAGTNPGA